MTAIDVHAHVIVPEALQKMSAAHPDFGPTRHEEEGKEFLLYPGRAPLGPMPPAMFDTDLRLVDMDRMRVDTQVVAIPPPNYHYHVPAEVGAEFARIQNEELVALSDAHPQRFHVFATLPLQDVSASLDEVERVSAIPRVRGVQIGTNVAGVDLDDPSLDPVWSTLEDHGLPVWLHADQRSIAGADRLDGYYLQNLIGIPMESTIAVAKLMLGGVLNRHGGLRFGVTHGGGFSPYQVGRWQHGWEVRPEPKTRDIGTTPRELFSTLYFDSLTHDPISLRMLGERVGWNHVMLGSDYPFDMSSADPVGAVETAGLDTDAIGEILATTAQGFLRATGDTT